MRWEPGSGLIRKARHLSRLEGSAKTLGFAFDTARIEDCLARIQPSDGALRIRLTLQADGSCELAQSAFQPLPEGTVWRLAVAKTRIDQDDPLIRHKITRRAVYEAARAEFSAEEADEVILLNRAGMVCEGTITNIFLRGADGLLRTPALSAGLLPGVLRAELLAEGQVREAEISASELRAGELFVGNSLRGLIPAKLAESGP
jgi:4-amino-4-deoxychorismate lyase